MGKVFVGKTIFSWARSFFGGQGHKFRGQGLSDLAHKIYDMRPRRFGGQGHFFVGRVFFFHGHGHFLVGRVKFFVAKFFFWWSRSFCREGHLFRGQGFFSSWARSVGKNLEL